MRRNETRRRDNGRCKEKKINGEDKINKTRRQEQIRQDNIRHKDKRRYGMKRDKKRPDETIGEKRKRRDETRRHSKSVDVPCNFQVLQLSQ